MERPGASGASKRVRIDNDLLANGTGDVQNVSTDVTFGPGHTVDDVMFHLLQSNTEIEEDDVDDGPIGSPLSPRSVPLDLSMELDENPSQICTERS